MSSIFYLLLIIISGVRDTTPFPAAMDRGLPLDVEKRLTVEKASGILSH
jgi:hypothetical protein